ncbi:MAG TPA: hypothetical protein VHA82_14520 [Ramlibacter sp.]|uniref:tetratricopeptide repeat protein n=1 Tax=Ramlibacter sp. TaxID=1917967 RepID=UPI002C395CEA|nr:hypothetical protein [Ramlibacter sp.]HVZ45021.1 hypothetical protein [Ramlibacter sp.]
MSTTHPSEFDAEAIRLIAEIGFIGARTGQTAAARALFQSLMVLRPESTMPVIGLAMSELGAENPEDAARILRDQGLKQYPGDGELLAFLALALHLAGHNAEAAKVLAPVLEGPRDAAEPHVRLASGLIDMINGGPSASRPAPRLNGHLAAHRNPAHCH